MSTSPYLAFIVPAQHVKTVKNELEEKRLLNKRIKIARYESASEDDKSMIIATTLVVAIEQPDLNSIESPSLEALRQKFKTTSIEGLESAEEAVQLNPLQTAIKEASHHLDAFLEAESISQRDLVLTTPQAYSIYQPLLLLPQTLLDSHIWKRLVSIVRRDSSGQGEVHDPEAHNVVKFLARIAAALSVTHIAVNAPIPTDKSTASARLNGKEEDIALDTKHEGSETFTSSNVLRSPTNLITLDGDFGPALQPFPQHVPSLADFEAALWVKTTQNTILQTWAPRYTMFSKGNVTEKARLLTLPSVTCLRDQSWAAVDLFAGIGYFAFSYARSGASKVLCWDLNPWSCEGLRRGAALNGWKSSLMVSPGQEPSLKASTGEMPSLQDEADAKLLVFCQSNSHATAIVANLRQALPPIRHVNCGMLPDAGQAWQTAVKCLDWHLGGWLHLHETVRVDRLEERAKAIRQAVEELVRELEMDAPQTPKPMAKKVLVEHVERVKSVGPRMLHIVIDVHLSSSQSGASVA